MTNQTLIFRILFLLAWVTVSMGMSSLILDDTLRFVTFFSFCALGGFTLSNVLPHKD